MADDFGVTLIGSSLRLVSDHAPTALDITSTRMQLPRLQARALSLSPTALTANVRHDSRSVWQQAHRNSRRV